MPDIVPPPPPAAAISAYKDPRISLLDLRFQAYLEPSRSLSSGEERRYIPLMNKRFEILDERRSGNVKTTKQASTTPDIKDPIPSAITVKSVNNDCDMSSSHRLQVKERGLNLVACGNMIGLPVFGQGSAIGSINLKMMRSFSDSVVTVKRLLHSQRNLILIKEAKAIRKLSNCLAFRQLIGFVSHNCSLSVKFVEDRKALAPISHADALTTNNPRQVSGALPADNSDMEELQPDSLLPVKSAIAVNSDLSMPSFFCS